MVKQFLSIFTLFKGKEETIEDILTNDVKLYKLLISYRTTLLNVNIVKDGYFNNTITSRESNIDKYLLVTDYIINNDNYDKILYNLTNDRFKEVRLINFLADDKGVIDIDENNTKVIALLDNLIFILEKQGFEKKSGKSHLYSKIIDKYIIHIAYIYVDISNMYCKVK